MNPRPLLLFAVVMLVGCEQRMIDQDKFEAYEAARLFDDGKAMQSPPPGTVARGDLAYDAALETRPELSAALLARGRQRYGIFCAPCHGPSGHGDGVVVARGLPAPPSYHIGRLRHVSEAHFVYVITHGWGAMYSYSARVPPEDRWAIAAYIRALQLSQHAKAEKLPGRLRDRLESAP